MASFSHTSAIEILLRPAGFLFKYGVKSIILELHIEEVT